MKSVICRPPSLKFIAACTALAVTLPTTASIIASIIALTMRYLERMHMSIMSVHAITSRAWSTMYHFLCTFQPYIPIMLKKNASIVRPTRWG